MKTIEELEAIIERNKKDFQVVGRTLKEIRDRELYRRYRGFERYCQERWKFSRAKVHRWITASDIRDELETFGNSIRLPNKESQYRALNDLKDKNLRVKVLRHLSDSGVKLTAQMIKQTADLFKSDSNEVVTARERKPQNNPKPTNWIRITKDEIELAYFHILLDPDQPKVQDFYIKMALTLEKGGSVVMALYPPETT